MHCRAWIPLVTATTLLAACNEPDETSPTIADAPSLAVAITPFLTSQPSQLKPLGPTTSITPILTVGDPLPGAAAGSGDLEVWDPIPDGLGAYAEGRDLIVFANHELSSPGVGGLFQYARVSRLVLDIPTLAVKSASYPVTGSRLLERLCSATWATSKEGLTPGYFLTGEESTTGANGGMTLAVSGSGEVTEMPWLGKFNHENTIAIPGFPGRIVLVGLDDSRGASELYMYVAQNRAEVLAGRGDLYVFTAPQSGIAHAGDLVVGQTISGDFRRITAPAAPAATLQAEVVSLGAFPFVRLEDGDYDRSNSGPSGNPAIYFVDTGSGSVTVCGPAKTTTCDLAGSIYRMEFDAKNPTTGARLTLMARSGGAASGWASPDNIALSTQSLMLQEDPAYSGFQRAPRIWRFPLLGAGLGAPEAVAEVDNPTCVEGSSDPSQTCWESSGIIDVSPWLGAGNWLLTVQAHGLAFTAVIDGEQKQISQEGGQLIRMVVPGS